MRRGRLIFPVLAEVHPFVPARAQDDDFKEPVLAAAGPDGPGRAAGEGPTLRLPCQVEPDELEAMAMHANGDAPRSRLNLIFHARDLRVARMLPKARDRLAALYSKSGTLLLAFPLPPGLYATEARPMSFGLSRDNAANLWRVTFGDRSQGIRRAG